MATISLKGPTEFTQNAVREWLLLRRLQHIKSHHNGTIKVGDALKSPLGFVAKVKKIEGRLIVISNFKLSKEELQNAF